MTIFARYDGIGKNGAAFSPWLSAVAHLSHQGGLDAAALKVAIAQRRVARTPRKINQKIKGASKTK